jgi:hypothetical protein
MGAQDLTRDATEHSPSAAAKMCPQSLFSDLASLSFFRSVSLSPPRPLAPPKPLSILSPRSLNVALYLAFAQSESDCGLRVELWCLGVVVLQLHLFRI